MPTGTDLLRNQQPLRQHEATDGDHLRSSKLRLSYNPVSNRILAVQSQGTLLSSTLGTLGIVYHLEYRDYRG